MFDTVAATNELFDQIENNIERSMFILHYLWGLSHKEIAHCFNITEELVRKNIEQAKDKISAAYK